MSTELRWFGRTLDKSFKGIQIVPISDLHYGNPYCSIKHFERTVDMILSTPDMFTILNGDLCEAAIRTSKGDIFKQVGTPQDQRDWVISKLMPIKDRILGCTMGNHEERIYKDAGIDISKDIAQALGCPYRPEGMLLKISFGHNHYNRGISTDRPYVYWIYATHGYGGARTKSAKAVKVERVATWIDANVYIMSHDHVVNAAPDIYLKPDNRGTTDSETGFVTGRVSAYRKVLVKTNSYVKWGGYAESGGFPPSDLNSPIITLAGEGKPRVNVTV